MDQILIGTQELAELAEQVKVHMTTVQTLAEGAQAIKSQLDWETLNASPVNEQLQKLIRRLENCKEKLKALANVLTGLSGETQTVLNKIKQGLENADKKTNGFFSLLYENLKNSWTDLKNTVLALSSIKIFGGSLAYKSSFSWENLRGKVPQLGADGKAVIGAAAALSQEQQAILTKQAEEAARKAEEDRIRAEEEARKKTEEEARKKAEEEARKKAEEEAKKNAPFSRNTGLVYENKVQAGTIRYIKQKNSAGVIYGDKSYYHSEYWPSWGGEYGCKAASTSMALSYLGIDKTPANLAKLGLVTSGNDTAGSGQIAQTLSKQKGIDLTAIYTGTTKRSDLDVALNNFLNSGGKYSPPVLCMKDSHGMHFVVVTGKNANGTYQIIDPLLESRTTLQFSGNTINYNSSTTLKGPYTDLIQYKTK